MSNVILFQESSSYIKLSEEELVGKTIQELNDILSVYEREKVNSEEGIFVLKSSFFGLVKTRLYLYFAKGLVRDYYIGM